MPRRPAAGGAAVARRGWQEGRFALPTPGRSRRYEVHELVDLFRRALITVGPIAEQAGVDWLQEPPYDDWDAIAEGLYEGFVSSALSNSVPAGKIGRFPRYGFEPEDGDAYLAASDAEPDLAFVGFAGGDRLLSAARFTRLPDRTRETWNWSKARLVLRHADGTIASHVEIEP